MATSKYPIVVEGEASETDSDEEIYITSVGAAHSTESGLKVLGEAPETDSEGEQDNIQKLVTGENTEITPKLSKEIPLLVVSSTKDPASTLEEFPVCKLVSGSPCNTLLQQKLQETNARLCSDVAHTLRQVYQNATREIQVATSHFGNSQNGIINASHSIRLIVEDLKSVSEKIDIITTCNLLPDIIINSS
ncbi:biogenesis of lysosome-related organelles complex 1 subunit 3 [Paramormyrops kingsleyae]|uniref:Biogenesis of lysosome-related organelles complex 1 subunit 3 n=1 Tax=Paramormyrops kingsleyae TaxID=1676925 RepID=A0A3B3RKC0_9TELE|nr:biogenesis of lysosome-related organelles complex 1 subunit 3 [Paramormyrops kingsleyae]